LTQSNGLPIQVKNVAKVSVGYVPRLGIAGRDENDDVVASIVVMRRPEHTNDVIPRVLEEVQRINTDGSLPPGVKIVSYYDRSSLVGVTTHTVLHNLIFGCLLVFFAGKVRLSETLRSRISSELPVPLNSSKMTSSMRLPVSTRAVAIMVSDSSGSSLAICAARSLSASTFRSRCSSPSSFWFYAARMPTCCRSARSISASSSTPP
jgi:hypothetical protein